jgi:hypothetical protein
VTRKSLGRKPGRETFADLAAAVAERLCAADRTRPASPSDASPADAAGQMSLPTLTEFDEFGFNTTTGEAGFDADDDPIRIARRPGRPPKPR